MEAIDLMREFRRPIDTIVHIGANDGFEANSYLAADASDVIYVEPIPAVYRQLETRVGVMPRHVALNALCADEVGKIVRFNVASNNGQSSSIFALGNHAVLHPDVGYTETIELQTTTMDCIREDRPAFKNVSLLVIDVQGAELLVLKGARRTLENTSAVYCEISDIRLYDGGCIWHEIVEFLSTFGFSMKYFRMGSNRYGDAFFIKDPPRLDYKDETWGPNIALDKQAKQSSVGEGSKPGEADNAVNGVKTGGYAFHTAKEFRPWWQVDLGDDFAIGPIVIFNRLDTASRRAYALEVFIGRSPNEWTLLHSQDGQPFGGINGHPLVVDAKGAAARFVRVQLATDDSLHLDQVEIYAAPTT